MLAVMKDCLYGRLHLGIRREVLARVQISHVAWEVAAGHFYPDAMAGFEDIARLPQRYPISVHPARSDRRGILQRFPKTRASNSLADVDCAAVGIYIGKCRGEVRIYGRGRSKES